MAIVWDTLKRLHSIGIQVIRDSLLECMRANVIDSVEVNE